MTPQERAARQRRANAGGLLDWGGDVVDAGVDAWNGMNTLQKASMAPVPIASDIAGVLGDVQMYREQPETRGLLNYGMTAASLLPFIPSVAATIGKGEKKRVGTTGQYVGAPKGMTTPRKLKKARDSYAETAVEGAGGRDWYDDSSKFISAHSANNERAGQVADMLAVTSARAPVNTNLGHVVKATVQDAAGKPIHTGGFPQNQSALIAKILDGQTPALGPKRQPFAENMKGDWMDEGVGNRAVHDIWQGRAFGYKKDSGKPWDAGFSDTQHAHMDKEMDIVNAQLNKNNAGGFSDWDNRKTQAAAWTGEKLRAGDVKPENTATHYGDYAVKHRANATYEQVPGQGINHMEGFADLPTGVKQDYTDRSNWMNDRGQDLLYSEAGLLTGPTESTLGMYTPKRTGLLETNPGNTATPLVNLVDGKGGKHVSADARNLLDSTETLRAYMDAQNAGAWNKPIAGNAVGPSTSLTLDVPNATRQQMLDAAAIGEGKGMFPVDTGNAIQMMNDIWSPEGAARTGSKLGKEMKAGLLGDELRGKFPGTDMNRTQIESGYLDFEDAWAKGDGAATRQLLDQLDKTPELLRRLDDSPALRKKALANLDRDIEFGGIHDMAPRADIQNARKIIAEGGFTGLRKALESGAVLPALAITILSTHALSGEEPLI